MQGHDRFRGIPDAQLAAAIIANVAHHHWRERLPPADDNVLQSSSASRFTPARGGSSTGALPVAAKMERTAIKLKVRSIHWEFDQTARLCALSTGAVAPRAQPRSKQLLLGTDAVDVVVNAIATRAGQIAGRNPKQHRRARAAHGRDERGLVLFPSIIGRVTAQS